MEGMESKLPIADYTEVNKRMEGMERAKLPIADYTEVNKEENGRNGKSKGKHQFSGRGWNKRR